MMIIIWPKGLFPKAFVGVAWVIKLFTFPGFIMSTFMTQLVCLFKKLPVYNKHYLKIPNNHEHTGPINYARINDPELHGLVLVIPFLLMTVIGFTLCYYGVRNVIFLRDFTGLDILFLWLGISFAANAFPHITEVEYTSKLLKYHQENKSMLLILVKLVFWLLDLGLLLRKIHIEFIYGMLIGILIPFLMWNSHLASFPHL